MPTPEEELMKARENNVKLGAAVTYAFAVHAALLKAAREMLPPSKHNELRLLTNKYLPEARENEEVSLEDLDPRIGAVISELLEARD
jgi:hypothetical protein